MKAPFEIISFADQEDKFLSCLEASGFKDAPTAEQFLIEAAYRKAFSGESFANISFAIQKNGQLEALILCYKYPEKLAYGETLELLCPAQDKRVLAAALEELNRLASLYGFESFSVSDYSFSHKLSPLGEQAYNRGAAPSCHFKAVVDLTQEEALIRRNLRKSYKSLVRWGEREINFTIINKDNPDKEQFEVFRNFHREVSGRVTRSIESWDAQFKMIEMGCAELLMGEIEPYGLVSTALCIDHGSTTSYGVAVYDRNLFDKPLGHASVHKSIMRAKARGQSSFSLGVIYQKEMISDKEYNIGVFKKGFCDKLTSFVEWRIPVHNS